MEKQSLLGSIAGAIYCLMASSGLFTARNRIFAIMRLFLPLSLSLPLFQNLDLHHPRQCCIFSRVFLVWDLEFCLTPNQMNDLNDAIKSLDSLLADDDEESVDGQPLDLAQPSTTLPAEGGTMHTSVQPPQALQGNAREQMQQSVPADCSSMSAKDPRRFCPSGCSTRCG